MTESFGRLSLLLGEEQVKKIADAKIAVFGVGGVGGYVCEALARSGIQYFDLFDKDTVSRSNINRQIIALESTLGKTKTSVMKKRMEDINPNVSVHCHDIFYLPETADAVNLQAYDYVVDAVDTVSAKIELAQRCEKLGVRIISAMGAGNKLNPLDFQVADIYETSVCPLARVMRRELKKRGVKKLKVVFSREEAKKPIYTEKIKQTLAESEKLPPGSCSFVPSVCGLIIASEVIKELISG